MSNNQTINYQKAYESAIKECNELREKRKLDLQAMAQMKRDNDLLKDVMVAANATVRASSGTEWNLMNDVENAITAYERRDK